MKVLHIEDNDPDAVLFKLALPDAAIDRAKTKAEASLRLAHHNYDIIVADLHLPDAEGPEIWRTLGRLAPQTPVIGLTGLKSVDLERSHAVHLQHIATKGIKPEKLAAVVHKYARKKSLTWRPVKSAIREVAVSLHDVGLVVLIISMVSLPVMPDWLVRLLNYNPALGGGLALILASSLGAHWVLRLMRKEDRWVEIWHDLYNILIEWVVRTIAWFFLAFIGVILGNMVSEELPDLGATFKFAGFLLLAFGEGYLILTRLLTVHPTMRVALKKGNQFMTALRRRDEDAIDKLLEEEPPKEK